MFGEFPVEPYVGACAFGLELLKGWPDLPTHVEADGTVADRTGPLFKGFVAPPLLKIWFPGRSPNLGNSN